MQSKTTIKTKKSPIQYILKETFMQKVSYVYFRIPSSFEVQIIMLLSAEPDANRFPREDERKDLQ